MLPAGRLIFNLVGKDFSTNWVKDIAANIKMIKDWLVRNNEEDTVIVYW